MPAHKWAAIATQDTWWVPLAGFARLGVTATTLDELPIGRHGKVAVADMDLDWRWAATITLWQQAHTIIDGLAGDPHRAYHGNSCTDRHDWFWALPLPAAMRAANDAQRPGTLFELRDDARGHLTDWVHTQAARHPRLSDNVTIGAPWALRCGYDEAACFLVQAICRNGVAGGDVIGALVADGAWATEAATAATLLEAHRT